MNATSEIVVSLPLPRQIVADNKAEMREKIKELRNFHSEFMATYYDQPDGSVKAFITS